MASVPSTSRSGVEAAGPSARARCGGFTLLELMAVIVILGILIAVLVPRLGQAKETVKEKQTRALLAQIDAALSEYENQFGDYPPSTFLEKWGTAPNNTNLGAETLVLSLWSPDWGGTGLSEDALVNTDNDQTKKAYAKFGKPALFEIADAWGNPIAYFHRRDFGRADKYVTTSQETGEEVDSSVTASMNPVTGTYYNPKKYQLISAGPDGVFGAGDDDIGNFTPAKKAEEK